MTTSAGCELTSGSVVGCFDNFAPPYKLQCSDVFRWFSLIVFVMPGLEPILHRNRRRTGGADSRIMPGYNVVRVLFVLQH